MFQVHSAADYPPIQPSRVSSSVYRKKNEIQIILLQLLVVILKYGLFQVVAATKCRQFEL